MENYYIIECRTKGVGIYPQIQVFKDNCFHDVKAQNSIYSLGKVAPDKFPDFEPEMNCIKLESKAKRTDFISNSLIGADHGFFVSKKVASIFNRILTSNVRFYPCILHHGNELLRDYLFMYVRWNMRLEIDFANSAFYVENIFNPIERSSVDIMSYEDYKFQREIRGRSNIIYPERVKLLSHNLVLPIITLSDLGNWICISQEVYEIFVQEKITGLEYRCFTRNAAKV